MQPINPIEIKTINTPKRWQMTIIKYLKIALGIMILILLFGIILPQLISARSDAAVITGIIIGILSLPAAILYFKWSLK